MHLDVGRLLLARVRRATLPDDRLFEIVNHLNIGADLIATPSSACRRAAESCRRPEGKDVHCVSRGAATTSERVALLLDRPLEIRVRADVRAASRGRRVPVPRGAFRAAPSSTSDLLLASGA